METIAANKSIISIAGTKGSRLYIYGVSFKDGDGYRIKKFQYGPDVKQAFEYSRVMAEQVSQSLANQCKGVRVHRPGGDVEAVQESAGHRAGREACNDIVRKFNQDLAREFLTVTGRR